MYPHCIRLREPWTREPQPDGGLLLRRGFHRPTVSGGERVWIVCEAPSVNATAALDGQPLGAFAAGASLWCCDVTGRLADRHELTILAAQGADGSGRDALPWREVRLEIRLHSTPDDRSA